MGIRKSFLIWWLLFSLQSFALYIAYYFGLIDMILVSDQTQLSIAIAMTWAFTSLIIGSWHVLYNKLTVSRLIKIGWFLSEVCLALGMIGTVAGFLLMLGGAFSDIDVKNTATLQTALTTMALGMSTALYTTLVGLISSIFLKSQLVNLEHLIDLNQDKTNVEQ